MTVYEVKAGRWLVSLGAKFAYVVPFRTLLVVLLTLFSQVSHLLAFFLPLKIVILLGSEGMPRYFPPSFAQFDRDLLVVLLGVATVGFFLAHALSERLIDWVTTGAAHLLMERSQKLVLFENQNQIAEGAYQGFARALAGLVFCLLALITLAWLYPEMAMVMSGYLALTAMLVLACCSRSEGARDWVSSNLNGFMGNLSALGFFTVFGYLVVDFVLLQPPGILVAILSILAGRQSFGRVAAGVGGLYRLYSQREKLDAIFFHGRPLLRVVADQPGSFWQHLAPGERGKWTAPLMQEFCDVDTPEQEEVGNALKWLQPATPDIGVFTYREDASVLLLKLYAHKRAGAAQHEATLLADAPKDLPAPDFLGASKFDSFPCGVYRLEPGKVVTGRHHRSGLVRVYSQLLLVEMQSPLMARYLRSMSTLPQRMSLVWLERLAVAVVTSKQAQALEGLRRYWQDLRDLLSALPLVIHNPSVKPGALWQAEPSGSLCLLHWEKWSLEPAGAGWPVGDKALEQLIQAHQHACNHRELLRNYPSEHLVLAALTYELEQHVKNQRLEVSVQTATQLWKTLEDFVVQQESEQELDSNVH
ncbi:hypothetical protein [Halomonas sp. C05BenzN]|uniref:hypothetical protein n=1 Tax=Halomonas sp. C05BenzN TaxID=3411041 RepID=UPI003B957526